MAMVFVCFTARTMETPGNPVKALFNSPGGWPEVETEIGRRDWTRTNDPHHVKVVL